MQPQVQRSVPIGGRINHVHLVRCSCRRGKSGDQLQQRRQWRLLSIQGQRSTHENTTFSPRQGLLRRDVKRLPSPQSLVHLSNPSCIYPRLHPQRCIPFRHYYHLVLDPQLFVIYSVLEFWTVARPKPSTASSRPSFFILLACTTLPLFSTLSCLQLPLYNIPGQPLKLDSVERRVVQRLRLCNG